jgi:hypothetical protein
MNHTPLIEIPLATTTNEDDAVFFKSLIKNSYQFMPSTEGDLYSISLSVIIVFSK